MQQEGRLEFVWFVFSFVVVVLFFYLFTFYLCHQVAYSQRIKMSKMCLHVFFCFRKNLINKTTEQSEESFKKFPRFTQKLETLLVVTTCHTLKYKQIKPHFFFIS